MLKAATDSEFVPAGHTLYFVRGADRVVFKLGRDGSCLLGSYSKSTFAWLTSDPKTVWLFDPADAGKSGAVPFEAQKPDVHGHVIMALSPNARHFCDNNKAGDPLRHALFFPDYSETEAEVVYNWLMPPADITEFGSFADRFRLVGGNLRMLLKCSMPLQRLESVIRATADEANVSHLLTFVQKHGNQRSPVTELWQLASTISSLLVKVNTLCVSRRYYS